MRNERAIFARRLREELKRQKFDYRPVALVKSLARDGGVSVAQQTISHWLHGKHLPRPEAMHGLSRMLGMDAYGLLREAESLGVSEPRMQWPDHVSGRDRLLFEEFLVLPHKQREMVRELIGSLAASTSIKQKRS